MPAVEEMYPGGTSSMQQESSRTVVQPQPARICVVEPNSVPGLDFGYLENQLMASNDYSKLHQDAAAGDYNSLRKEFGTQTGMLFLLVYTYPVSCGAIMWWLDCE